MTPGATSSDPTSSDPSSSGPLSSGNRALTIGMLLSVSLNAFAALAVVTIAPRIPADIGGLSLYGWVFSTHLLFALLGTVWGGLQADRRGVLPAFVTGLVCFGLGLLLAGLAPSMLVLIVARALQGFGASAMTTCVYVVTARAYPDRMRPTLMAYLSSAWVLPALLGPALAGVIADQLGWRWVFLGLLPLLAVIAPLTLPRFAARPELRAVTTAPVAGWRPLLPAASVVLGVGLLLAGLTALAEAPTDPLRLLAWWASVAVGAVMTWRGLGPLLPPGTLRLRPGLGALVAARAGFFAAFIGMEAYLALMLSDVHGASLPVTGMVIASGAISWSLGSWLQARREQGAAAMADLQRSRLMRVRSGVLVLALGLVVQLLALLLPWAEWFSPLGPVPVATVVTLLGWMVCGLGIGFAHATSSVLSFALAEQSGVATGSVSSSLQLADNIGAALATGIGGAALAWATLQGGSLQIGLAAAFAVAYLAITLSVVALAGRSWRRAPASPAPR